MRLWHKLDQLLTTNLRVFVENWDDFYKLILDLANVDIKIEDEDKAIIILNYLPKSFSNFVDTTKYGRESLI